jgi:diguanylate cyclase (GGDEF)-like protein
MIFRGKIEIKRYSWRYLLAILAGLIFVAINLTGSYKFGAQLIVGFTPNAENDQAGVLVQDVNSGSPAYRANLTANDLIVAVNGKPVKNLDEYIEVVHKQVAAKTLTLKVKRADGEHIIKVERVRRLSLTRFAIGVILVLIFLVVGLICYFKSPQDERAQVALLLFLAIAANNAALVDYLPADSTHWIDQALSICNTIIRSLALGMIGVLPLYVPQRKKILDRSKWILLLVFAPAIILAVLTLIDYQLTIHQYSYRVMDQKLFALLDLNLLHALFIYGPLMLLHTYRQAENAAVRRQAKTMIYGISCWAAINTLLLFADRNMSGSMLGDSFYANSIDVLLPITVFFTVYRHKLFDIDVLIRKSLTYTLVSGALLVFYFSLVAITTWLIAATFKYQSSVVTVAFSTLMVGFGFTPVRRYSQRLVDRMFFREKYDYLNLINEIFFQLTASLDLDRITEELSKKLFAGMKLKQIAVLIPDEQQSCYLVRCTQGEFSINDIENRLMLRSSDKIISLLALHKEPISAQELTKYELSGREAEAMAALGSELFVPIVLRQLVAVLALGEKQSEAAFDEDDLNFLSTVGRQAAIVMENARLFELATYDGLTALMRRTAFEGVFEDEIRRCRRYHRNLSLLMIDIDHFKTFNDTYGHAVGDFVLKRVAQAIKDQLRATDTPSRYGGEEFSVLLSETGHAAALKVAENLRARIATLKLDIDNGREVQITVSIGVFSGIGAELPDAAEIYSRADMALYQAKAQGRNRVNSVVNSGIREEIGIGIKEQGSEVRAE